MAWAKPTKITSWSYSRYDLYNKCPAKAKYKFIDKLPEPPAPAMERGNVIHKLAEQYTKGELKKLPQELKLFEEEFKELRKSNPIVEQTWAFRSDWSPTVWNDWSGCAVRIKTDAACVDDDTLYVIDHKTGKKREGYELQLSLYALGGLLTYPDIKKVSTQLWYLDEGGDPIVKGYEVTQLPELKADWERRVQPMLNDTRFAPKPSNECRWCPFSKSKGGPCKF